MCSPSISLWDAEVTLDLASHNVTSVHPWGPLGSNNGTDPTYAQFAGNVTGVPLEGRAYNGLFFNVSDPDAFTVARQDAVGLMLPAAVMQAAIQSGVGLDGAFGTQMFPQLTVGVYVSDSCVCVVWERETDGACRRRTSRLWRARCISWV